MGVQYPTIGVSIIDLSPGRKVLALLGHLFLGFQKRKLEREINVVNTMSSALTKSTKIVSVDSF